MWPSVHPLYAAVIGKAIAGTTDSPTEVTHLPHPTEEDIRFILQEIKDYLSPDISGTQTGAHSKFHSHILVPVAL